MDDRSVFRFSQRLGDLIDVDQNGPFADSTYPTHGTTVRESLSPAVIPFVFVRGHRATRRRSYLNNGKQKKLYFNIMWEKAQHCANPIRLTTGGISRPALVDGEWSQSFQISEIEKQDFFSPGTI